MPERFQSRGEIGAATPRAFRHVTDEINTPVGSACSNLTNADWSSNPNVRLFFSHVIRDPSDIAGNILDADVTAIFANRSPGVWGWTLCRTDGLAMPVAEKFNIIAYDSFNDHIFADGLETR